MYTPDLAPVADSLAISSLIAMLPLLTVFLLLGWRKWQAHWAGLAALGVAAIIAIFVYDMPAHLTALSATQGFAFGIFPIMWIVFNAIWLYELTVKSGRFEDLRLVIDRVSDDPRIQAVIIAFCFGGLLEALAGFGAPVAITGVMLLAIGFTPLRAATIVLLANTAPVAFGAIAIPIITAGNLTGIDYHTIGAYVGHQTPLVAWCVPLFLVFIADGKRGIRQTWPVALTLGVVFSITQWVCSTWVSVELTDIIAALTSLASAVIMLRFWKPKGSAEAHASIRAESEEQGVSKHRELSGTLTGSRVFMALFPYLLVIGIFTMAKLWTPMVNFLASTDVKIKWPGLDGNIFTADGKLSTSTVYTFSWLSSPGTLLLFSGIIVAIVYRVRLADCIHLYGENLYKMRYSILTVSSVLALAYVMNQSGQTITIGYWIAGAGAAFAFVSPILGWLGSAVTGSDTSANALFATLQQAAAEKAGIDPTLMVAANTSGGVVGKMLSPQNLTIAATAVGLIGRESEIFRKLILWSLGLLAVICLIIGLQSTSVLGWMLP